MIRPRIRRLPSTLTGWAAAAVAAYLGARQSIDPGMTGAIWAAGGAAVATAAALLLYRTLAHRAHHTADCTFRTWAEHAYLVGHDGDGNRTCVTLASLRETGEQHWELPTAAAVIITEGQPRHGTR